MKAQSDDTYSDATNTDAHKARAKKKKKWGVHSYFDNKPGYQTKEKTCWS